MGIPVGLFAWLGWSRRWMSEDGFINLRVVRNLLDGHGPVFNPGERIEVYTSAAWVGVETVLAALLRPIAVEWIAVGAGLALAVAGLVAGAWGALLLRGVEGRRVVLPLGLAVVAGLPPYWDFATSGLETGLSLAWLGGSFLASARALIARREPGSRRWVLAAIAVGLGPLVRPDLSLVSLPWLAVLLWTLPGRSVRSVGRLALVAAAVPVSYQVFRMGYFASVVPNTALGKEAFAGNARAGLAYVADFVRPYHLWIPALIIGAWLMHALRRVLQAGGRAQAAVMLAPVLGGALHLMYVVMIGGDFMHARFLLPAAFAALLPVMVVVVDRHDVLRMSAVAVVLVWAAVSATVLRVPYPDLVGPTGLSDERGFWAAHAGTPNPVTVDDYAGTWLVETGRRMSDTPRRVLALPAFHGDDHDGMASVPLRRGLRAESAVMWGNIGLLGYAASADVHVVDPSGLGDPLSARVALGSRGRAGHEKHLPSEWAVARFGAGGAVPEGTSPEGVELLRAVLRCDEVRSLLDAVTDPMTPSRFASNLWSSPRYTRLRIPPEPPEAAAAFCPTL